MFCIAVANCDDRVYDIEIPHSEIWIENINVVSPYKNIDDLLKNVYNPND
jgi:hypothetical protein